MIPFNEENPIDKMWISEKTNYRWLYYYGDSAYVLKKYGRSIIVIKYQMSNGTKYRKPICMYSSRSTLGRYFRSGFETMTFYNTHWSPDFVTLCNNLNLNYSYGVEKNCNRHYPFVTKAFNIQVNRLDDGLLKYIYYSKYDFLQILHYASPRNDPQKDYTSPVYSKVMYQTTGETLWVEKADTIAILFSREKYDEITMMELL